MRRRASLGGYALIAFCVIETSLLVSLLVLSFHLCACFLLEPMSCLSLVTSVFSPCIFIGALGLGPFLWGELFPVSVL